MDPLARGPETCLSNLELDRLIVDEPQPSEASARVAAHLASCARCAARLGALRAEAQAFPNQVFLAGLVQRTRRPAVKRPAVWLGGLSALAAAAALVLFVRPAPTVGIKGGGFALEVFARRAGRVEAIVDEAVLSPGDAIGFRIASQRPGYVVVIGLDTRPSVTAYVPSEGKAIPIAEASRQTLPGSITLDETLGPERLIALRCEEPVAASEIVRVAERALSAAGGDPRRVVGIGSACSEATLLIHKQKNVVP